MVVHQDFVSSSNAGKRPWRGLRLPVAFSHRRASPLRRSAIKVLRPHSMQSAAERRRSGLDCADSSGYAMDADWGLAKLRTGGMSLSRTRFKQNAASLTGPGYEYKNNVVNSLFRVVNCVNEVGECGGGMALRADFSFTAWFNSSGPSGQWPLPQG
jgi:hypothetical protein